MLNSYLATIKRLTKIAHSPKDTEQTKAREDPNFDLPRVELKKAKNLMMSLTRTLDVDGNGHDSCVMLANAAFDGIIPPAIETKCVTVSGLITCNTPCNLNALTFSGRRIPLYFFETMYGNHHSAAYRGVHRADAPRTRTICLC